MYELWKRRVFGIFLESAELHRLCSRQIGSFQNKLMSERSRRYQGYHLVISMLWCGITTVTLTQFILILQRKTSQGLGPALGQRGTIALGVGCLWCGGRWCVPCPAPAPCIADPSLLWAKPHGPGGRMLLSVTGLWNSWNCPPFSFYWCVVTVSVSPFVRKENVPVVLQRQEEVVKHEVQISA